jgi:hypothetical protein
MDAKINEFIDILTDNRVIIDLIDKSDMSVRRIARITAHSLYIVRYEKTNYCIISGFFLKYFRQA